MLGLTRYLFIFFLFNLYLTRNVPLRLKTSFSRESWPRGSKFPNKYIQTNKIKNYTKQLHVIEAVCRALSLVLKTFKDNSSVSFQSFCNRFHEKGAEWTKAFLPNSVRTSSGVSRKFLLGGPGRGTDLEKGGRCNWQIMLKKKIYQPLTIIQ